MPFWNPNHPEREEVELRALAWKQAAELATCDPQQAATLLIAYETASRIDSAARAGAVLETARADAFARTFLAAYRLDVQPDDAEFDERSV